MAVLHGWIHNYDRFKNKNIEFEIDREYGVISHTVGMNGSVGCHFYICQDQFGSSFERLFDKLTMLVEQDKDVFGLIYLYNNEDPDYPNDWQVWVIRQGFIEKTKDPFLNSKTGKMGVEKR